MSDIGRPVRPDEWLPEGKRAAVVWTIDDIHPGTSKDPYEAGGDLAEGALGHIEWLLERHPRLHVTLFTTADWREIGTVPSRRLLGLIPGLRERWYLAPTHPKGTMSVDRHPRFVAYLRGLPRTEVGVHGLHHVHPGPRVMVEFQKQDVATCKAMVSEALAIFQRAGLEVARGMTPPGWNLPAGLAQALAEMDFLYVASARDIVTPVSPDAVTDMSGIKGVSLIHPQRIQGGRLIHFTSNFQATNDVDRAVAVIEHGGLLAVKAHIVKTAFDHVQLDGMDALYRNYLDVLFGTLENRYGDALWWTTMGAVANRIRKARTVEQSP